MLKAKVCPGSGGGGGGGGHHVCHVRNIKYIILDMGLGTQNAVR